MAAAERDPTPPQGLDFALPVGRPAFITAPASSAAMTSPRTLDFSAETLAQTPGTHVEPTLLSMSLPHGLDPALASAGDDGSLGDAVADIFSAELNARAVRGVGCRLRLLVEQRSPEFLDVETNPVIAAELTVRGVTHEAYRFVSLNGQAGYYRRDGRATSRSLLRLPVASEWITSGFGPRRHPVLGRVRDHEGIDIGAGLGQPVWSVGPGQVIHAGWHGHFGNLVEVRHQGGWVSQYAHLSYIAVQQDQWVSQKEFIGEVGDTGLATGPHLHYGLKWRGRFVDATRQHFMRGVRLPSTDMRAFTDVTVRARQALHPSDNTPQGPTMAQAPRPPLR